MPQKPAFTKVDITKHYQTLASRIEARTTRGPECWEWNGARHNQGYGVLRVDGRVMKAHRIAYALAHGEVPADRCVLHTCDNPSCVNPAHLVLGTQADNNHDRHAKGRSRGGAKPKKLNAQQVQEIRRLAGTCTQAMLARRFGVSQPLVCAIQAGRVWRASA